MVNVFDGKEINTASLRDCQVGAYESILAHFSGDDVEKHVLIQLPTGTGKSALIATAPFGLAKNKVLIITPNLTLSKQLEDDLDISGNPEGNVYKKLDILNKEVLGNPDFFVLKLEDKANYSDIDEHHIIISNFQQLGDLEKWFKGREDLIDLIIIDEAHHQMADTYQNVINFFKNAKIISLTATPFRSDGKKIVGKNIYTYHFSDAVKKGYIRNIKVNNVTPKEISLSFSDEDNKIYTLDDIIGMKEEAWFRKNIALSSDCCDSIARKSFEKLQQLKKDFPNSSHQIIASAMSLRHAREFVKPAFEKLGLRVGLVSSFDKCTNPETFEKLKQNKIDVIINIGMLGEGFDHKKLGVAAIFRPFATLNPYIQFIGRAIRKNDDTKYCYIVSHLGLNQSKRFEEFKLFDNEDRDFLETLLSDTSNPGGSFGGELSFVDEVDNSEDDNTIVIKELGEESMDFESEFVKDDEKIIEQIDKLSEEARLRLIEKINLKYDSIKFEKKKSLKPVEKRRAAKLLLNEKEKSVASDIIKKLNLKIRNRDFNPMFANFTWVKKKVSKMLNEKAKIKSSQRNSLSNQQLEEIEEKKYLQEIKTECLDYFSKKIQEKASK